MGNAEELKKLHQQRENALVEVHLLEKAIANTECPFEVGDRVVGRSLAQGRWKISEIIYRDGPEDNWALKAHAVNSMEAVSKQMQHITATDELISEAATWIRHHNLIENKKYLRCEIDFVHIRIWCPEETPDHICFKAWFDDGTVRANYMFSTDGAVTKTTNAPKKTWWKGFCTITEEGLVRFKGSHYVEPMLRDICWLMKWTMPAWAPKEEI